MTSRQSPKRTKRMWVVVGGPSPDHFYSHVSVSREAAIWGARACKSYQPWAEFRRQGFRCIPVTVTWSSPNKRKAKR